MQKLSALTKFSAAILAAIMVVSTLAMSASADESDKSNKSDKSKNEKNDKNERKSNYDDEDLDDVDEYSSEQLIIGYEDEDTTPEKIAIRKKSRDDVEAISSEAISPRDSKTEVMKLGKRVSVKEAILRLRNQPGIKFVEPDYKVYKMATSTDSYFVNGGLWGMYGPTSAPTNPFGSNAAAAWAVDRTGSANVAVGVIDEGIQVLNPELNANMWVNPGEIAGNRIDDDKNGYVDDVNGWDFAGNNATVYDGGTLDQHGTHVAGTIGARANNGNGVVGVNWNVKIISTKFLAANGGTTSNAIRALDYLTDLKRRNVVNIVATNNSWGGGGFSQALLDAINRGGDQNILFVAAAGNAGANNNTTASYPSNYVCNNGGARSWDCVIAVAAINSTGAKSSFSNFGSTTVDIGAPGEAILSTVPVAPGWASFSGTSMATPHVTGAAALCESINPSLSASQIREAILNTKTPTLSMTGLTTTGGRLDINAMASYCATLAYVPLTLANPATVQTLPSGLPGTGYLQRIQTVNGTGQNKWSIASGSLPTGLTLLGGVISGTPTTSGTFVSNISVTDDSTILSTQVTIVIAALPPAPLSGAFNLSSPANGANNQNTTPSLSWGSSSSSVSYLYCYSTATTCIPNISTTSRSVRLPSLVRRTTYFWTVVALNSSGAARPVTSGTWQFTTR
jgi:subtilisin family serine protease